jgi:hypothetical protein
MTYDVSIIMPAIRTPNWDKMYETIKQSCKKYSFELVMCGPFPLTKNLQKQKNVRMIIDNGSPSRCAQIAAINANGNLLAHLVDDALFVENSLDQSVELYNTLCNKKDVINLRYTEGVNFNTKPMPPNYWQASYHAPLRQPAVPHDFKISCHHLIDSQYFKELGGYDCSYEYQNLNLHDLMFRVQYDGGKIYDSPNIVTNCDYDPFGQVDHKPIESAFNDHDFPLFNKMYSKKENLSQRIKIPLNNWQNSEKVWKRRFFNGVAKNYEEIVKNNGCME